MISIIIPFYNTEKYIEQCLTSIKGQTFSDFECLMIDDGSTDSSREIAKKFLEDSRFRLLGDKHIGFPHSKNLGLDNAKGDYICFVDSDDYILPQYLELLYKSLIDSNSDICSCGIIGFRDKEPVVREMPYRVTSVINVSKISMMFERCSTFMWNKIYKREIFEDMRFDNVIALSDTMLCYKLFEKANKISFIPNKLICHRHHNENMTYQVRNFEPTYWPHRLNVYLTMCSYLLEKYPSLERLLKDKFRSELRFIKPHLSKEIYESYLNREDVKILLN